MQSKLTLIGLYNYDNTVLDLLSFPEGIDKQLAISTILLRCGEFELLYPSLPFVKSLCDVWSKKHYRTFEKWVAALEIEYDPLNNYDRHEKYTDEHSGKDVTSGSNSGSSSGSTSGYTTPATTTNTRTENVSAFDASTYQPKSQTTDAFTVQATGSDSTTVSSSNSGTSSETLTHGEKIDHDAHLWGNIGVTTSQEMLKAELDVARFNLYDQIADIFCEEFCLMIY